MIPPPTVAAPERPRSVGSLVKIVALFIAFSVLSGGLGAKIFSPQVWSVMTFVLTGLLAAAILIGIFGVLKDLGRFGKWIKNRGRRESTHNELTGQSSQPSSKAEILDEYFELRRSGRMATSADIVAPTTMVNDSSKGASRSSVRTAHPTEFDDDLIDVDEVPVEAHEHPDRLQVEETAMTEAEREAAFRRTLEQIRDIKTTDPTK